MMPVEYHPSAREEAKEAYLYLADKDEELALDFEKKVQEAVQLIRRDPLAWRVRAFNVRRVNLPRFKEQYIAYMIWREKVVILAVAHAKRRPYYWRNRIGEARKMF